jgi:hypothetical protein
MRYTNEDNNKDKDRFRLLLEYDFYIGEEEEVFEPEGELVTEEPPQDELDGEEVGGDELGGEEGFGDEGGEELGGEPEEGFGDEGGEEEGFGDELPEPEMEPEPEALPPPEPMEDEIELDVTELVQGTEEAKLSADRANQQITTLMAKFDNLNASLEKMSAINAKIDNLEHEVEKRNPTPEEQLEMRSLDSFPYSLKLTDYWSEKEGNYDAMSGKESKDKKEEYTLTQDEVDRDYNAIEVKDSFTNPEQGDEFKSF